MATCRQRTAAATRWTLLTLTVALVVAWPVSQRWEIGIVLSRRCGACLADCSVWLYLESPDSSAIWPVQRGPYALKNRPRVDVPFFVRFAYHKNSANSWVAVPVWLIMSVLGVGTLAAWRARLRTMLKRDGPKARRKRGACVSCGYDRRGLPREGGCPECGSVPTA